MDDESRYSKSEFWEQPVWSEKLTPTQIRVLPFRGLGYSTPESDCLVLKQTGLHLDAWRIPISSPKMCNEVSSKWYCLVSLVIHQSKLLGLCFHTHLPIQMQRLRQLNTPGSMPQLFQRPCYMMGYLGVQLGLLVYIPSKLGYNHYRNYCIPIINPIISTYQWNCTPKHPDFETSSLHFKNTRLACCLLDQEDVPKKCSRTHPPVIAQNYGAPLQIQNLYSQYWWEHLQEAPRSTNKYHSFLYWASWAMHHFLSFCSIHIHKRTYILYYTYNIIHLYIYIYMVAYIYIYMYTCT